MHLWILQKEGIEEYLEVLQHDYLGIRANPERMCFSLIFTKSSNDLVESRIDDSQNGTNVLWYGSLRSINLFDESRNEARWCQKVLFHIDTLI